MHYLFAELGPCPSTPLFLHAGCLCPPAPLPVLLQRLKGSGVRSRRNGGLLAGKRVCGRCLDETRGGETETSNTKMTVRPQLY